MCDIILDSSLSKWNNHPSGYNLLLLKNLLCKMCLLIWCYSELKVENTKNSESIPGFALTLHILQHFQVFITGLSTMEGVGKKQVQSAHEFSKKTQTLYFSYQEMNMNSESTVYWMLFKWIAMSFQKNGLISHSGTTQTVLLVIILSIQNITNTYHDFKNNLTCERLSSGNTVCL